MNKNLKSTSTKTPLFNRFWSSKRQLFNLAAIGFAATLLFYNCTPASTNITDKYADQIFLNQVGYVIDMPKIALSKVKTVAFYLVDSTGRQVYSGEAKNNGMWPFSGDTVAKLDFSKYNKPGTYRIIQNDSISSYPFIIAKSPYNTLSHSSIKAFYYKRVSVPIESKYAGKWARPSAQPDTIVFIHKSAADKKRPEGTIVSSPGGWYDAGDYGKYVVNSCITNYTLLKALSDYSSYYDTLNLNIPESSNNLPDLLDETLVNLRWVMSMQDPNDGGVYHKLTAKRFEPFVLPHLSNEPRFMVLKTTAAALDYAALLASASRVIKQYENQLPQLSDSCIKQAIYAWDWALQHKNIYYVQPEGFQTGQYDDVKLMDEWFWASCELYLATGEERFKQSIIDSYQIFNIPKWDNVGTLGVLSLMNEKSKLPKEIIDTKFEKDYLSLIDTLMNIEDSSAFQTSINAFTWGSNSDVANIGMLKLVAYNSTGDNKYFKSALNDLDYLLGRNATGYCFVTATGSKSPLYIHDRTSDGDSIAEPLPGWLAGGPNIVTFGDCGEAVKRSTYPAKSYADVLCSYSTNEIAINWNAPLAYLANGINANKR